MTTWNKVMVDGWATRLVAVTSLLIRLMVDTQAGVAAAMLASLLLESSRGVKLSEVASISILRYRATAWTLAQPVVRGLSGVGLLFPGLLALLLLTSLALQFSSTILLSDLQLSPLPGHFQTSHRPIDFSYDCIMAQEECAFVWFNQIPRGTAWAMSPLSFPAFAEYAEPVKDLQQGVDDTGVLLRAFLPMPDAESRQSLRNHSGSALVMDSRVSCQAPALHNVTWNQEFYGQISGIVANSINTTRLQHVRATPFLCSFAGPDQMSLCQIGHQFPYLYIGSLLSQFSNDTVEDENTRRYGTAFLVLNPTNKPQSKEPETTADISPNSTVSSTRNKAWTELSTADFNSTLSLSLCFAPWDAARLDSTMHSSLNRTEPTLRWVPPPTTHGKGTFDMTAVLSQLGLIPNATRPEDRGTLTLELPNSFTPPASNNALPPRQRPFIQPDMAGTGGCSSGANFPLMGNHTTFLSGHTLVKLLSNFTTAPLNALAADPALASLFNAAFRATNGSVAHALSSLITTLSSAAYYSQLPAFDHPAPLRQVHFVTVLVPVQARGLAAVVWMLAAYTAVLCAVVTFFTRRTRMSMLGEAWAAVGQVRGTLAGGRDGGQEGRGGSVEGLTDKEVVDMLERAGKGMASARVMAGEGGVGARVVEVEVKM